MSYHKKMRKIPTFVFLMAFHIILGQTIQVPIDHRDPQLGTFELEYGFGADFNPDLPTVVLSCDILGNKNVIYPQTKATTVTINRIKIM